MQMQAEPTGQVILACWGMFLAFWFAASFKVKPVAEGTALSRNSALMRMSLVIIAVLIASRGMPELFGTRLLPHDAVVGVAADVLAVSGLLLMLWARVALGGNWSAGVAFKQGHELISHGPYAAVRHPIYTGLLLLFLGEAVWFGNLAWACVFAAIATGFWFKAMAEERMMTKHFPDAYPAYRARTKALVPFLL